MAAGRCMKIVVVLLLAIVVLFLPGCSSVMVPDPNVRYLAFGDSTTAGPTDREYWQILQEKLGQAPETFAGQGKGGESAEEGVSRLQELLDNGIYPNNQVLLYWQGGDEIVEFVKDHDPLLLISPEDPNYPFTTELNQQLDKVQGDIEKAIGLAQGAGWKVYAATYYYMRENMQCRPALLNVLLPPQAANANGYVRKLNERIRTAVANRNAVLVDIETIADSLRADSANYADCNHLSEQGNEAVADLFLQVMQSQ